MRDPIKRGGAEISRRIAEKRTDWNFAYLKRTSCPEESEWRFFGGNTRAMTIPKEITQAIIGAAIRIQGALEPGLLEDAYKLCLAHSLRMDGHKVPREVYVDIEWEGLLVERAYRMDLVVDDRVVVEAKTVEKRVDAHFAQVNSQLRFSGLEVGLLLNFRQWPLKEGVRRVVHTRS